MQENTYIEANTHEKIGNKNPRIANVTTSHTPMSTAAKAKRRYNRTKILQTEEWEREKLQENDN